MQSEDAAEKLLKQDDIATSLIVDSLMGFRRRKLSGLDLPPTTEGVPKKTLLSSIVSAVEPLVQNTFQSPQKNFSVIDP